MYYVYILKLENGSFCIGYTKNLKQRLKHHKSGSTTTTNRVKPVGLEFYAAFVTEAKAREFEVYLKTNSGFAFGNKRLIT